jgi:hypothetical protein
MARFASGWLPAALAAAIAAARPAPADLAREESLRARGATAIAQLKQGLVAELTAALASGGAEHAISVCRTRAAEIARAASAGGVRVGRTSHKLRNPANAAPDWVVPLLARYVAGERASEPTLVALDGGRAGYVEPLFMAPLCLTCHGDALEPALQAKLRSLYPEDRAVGFRVGELRGLAWAEIEPESASAEP